MKNMLSTLLVIALLALVIYATYSVKHEINKSVENLTDAFNQNFEAYPNILSSVSRSENGELTELDKIMKLYESKDYKGLIKETNKYLNNYPERYQLKFYRGIAYLETNDNTRAIKDFEDVLLQNKELTEQAEWYLGLTYLKSDDQASSFDIFTKIAASNGVYAHKANQVLVMQDYAPGANSDKYYRITDEGKFEFIYWANPNPESHPVTERTLFLETSRQGLMPGDLSYYDYLKLTIPEKQNLLMNAQQETLAAIENSKKDIFTEIGGTEQPDPGALAALQNRLKEIRAEEHLQAQPVEDIESQMAQEEDTKLELTDLPESVGDFEEAVLPQDTIKMQQTEVTYEQPRQIPDDLKLPWIVNMMLKPERGIEVPEDRLTINKNSDTDVSWVVKSLTNPNARID